MKIERGVVFATAAESGCVALTEPGDFGEFDGIDSDGVVCQFSEAMVTQCASTVTVSEGGIAALIRGGE